MRISRVQVLCKSKLQGSFNSFPFFGLQAMRITRYWYTSSARLVDPPHEK